MRKENLKLSLAAMLAVVLCAGLASAQPAGGDDGPRPRQGDDGERPRRGGGNMQRLFEGIELTDEQKEQVKTIREENASKLEETRSEMRSARESGDREKMKEAGDKMKKLTEETNAAVREILTDDQKATFDENLKKMEEQRAERQQRRGERGERGERGDRPEREDRPERPRPPAGDEGNGGNDMDI